MSLPQVRPTLARYEPDANGEMIEHPYGEFVRYVDHREVIQFKHDTATAKKHADMLFHIQRLQTELYAFYKRDGIDVGTSYNTKSEAIENEEGEDRETKAG